MKLLPEERKAFKIFRDAIKRWRKILLIDPIWDIGVVIVEEQDRGEASVDIGATEYYVANINICRMLLSLEDKDLVIAADNVASHELLHVLSADYQRAALIAAGGNTKMQEEMRYRYEQLISKLSMVLMELDYQPEKCEHEQPQRKNIEPPAEVLPVPEVPIRKAKSRKP